MTMAETSPAPSIHPFRFEIDKALRTLGIIALTTLAAFAVRPARGEVSGALVFVLGITCAGAISGLAGALTAAMAGFLLYNFYFAEPILTFRLSTFSDFEPLVVFNLCALISGILAGRLKDRGYVALQANQDLANLLAASEALQSTVTVQDVSKALAQGEFSPTDLHVQLFRPVAGSLIAISEADPLSNEIATDAYERPNREIVRRDGRIALRLKGGEAPSGVLVADASAVGRDDAAFIAALANLVGLAFERATLSELVAERRASARTEELKSSLLSSVSHDFRTPLATISASASSLIAYRDQLDEPTSKALLRGIVEEAERLNRYATNLLELSRLEAGHSPAQLQTLGVSDMLAAAIQRTKARMGGRRIERAISGDDPLVVADTVLFELVLVNVIENAIFYSDDNTVINISAIADNGHCLISIADQGIGIPHDKLDRVFDRFYQVPHADRPQRGSGLGLAIAKAFVGALAGTIEARSPGPDGSGTMIMICLPLAASVPNL